MNHELTQHFHNRRRKLAGKIFVGGRARTCNLALQLFRVSVERLFCPVLFWLNPQPGKVAEW